MVQFSPATREARVRFPADAYVLSIVYMADFILLEVPKV